MNDGLPTGSAIWADIAETAEPLRQALLERLQKADGHINAAERKLWHETERGLWSAHQAKARLAEICLWLEQPPVELPALERYLPQALLQQRLEEFAQASKSARLEEAWAETAATETAIRAEPFPPSRSELPPARQRDLLNAGLARQRRLYNALRQLANVVEEEFAQRYLSVRPGDWLRIDGRQPGCVISLQGLRARLLYPDAELDQTTHSFHLAYVRAIRCAPPADNPITVPGYYPLVFAANKLEKTRQFLQKPRLFGFETVRDALLTALGGAARAFWLTWAPASPAAAYPLRAREALHELEAVAPAPIAEPLLGCLHRLEELSGWRGRLPPSDRDLVWAKQLSEAAALAELGLTALEASLEPRIDLTEGDWIRYSDLETGRLAYRNGTRLILDLGERGVAEARLFRDFVQRVAPSADGETSRQAAWRARWLWFSHNTAARGDRHICPCCGLPGIVAAAAACRTCGWLHDGGDYDPNRRNCWNPDLTLALGRQRFAALGYAAIPAEAGDDWHAPLTTARRLRLVAALDALVAESVAGNDPRLERIATLWRSL